MTETSDLRSTLGWRLCTHARLKTAERGVTIKEVLEAIQRHESTEPALDWGPGRYIYRYRDLAIVVIPETKWVITVLWNNPARWTSEEFRAAHADARAA